MTPDHYVTRLLHADGVPLEDLGVGQGPLTEAARGAAWRLLCEHWHVFRGTPVRYWLEAELAEIFEVTERPSAATADASSMQSPPGWPRTPTGPRALYERFGISVLATTDDPASTCRRMRRCAPTRPGTAGSSRRSGPTATSSRPSRAGRRRRRAWRGRRHRRRRLRRLPARRSRNGAGYFIAHGAVSADHSHADARTDPLDRRSGRIYAAALAGEATAAEALAFRRHMVLEMARMSCDDGLVMTLHPGVHRHHHRPTVERFGPDTGSDIPIRVEFTEALQPLLARFGTHPGSIWSSSRWTRRCGHASSPRWPASTRRCSSACRGGSSTRLRRCAVSGAAVTETAGFSRTSGFVDDTRAFCSIPARHDMSRRVDAGYLAGWSPSTGSTRRRRCETARRTRPRPATAGVQALTPPRRLSRAGGAERPAAPVRIVHLGPGQLLPRPSGLVHRAPPTPRSGAFAAFAGRSADLAAGWTGRTACTRWSPAGRRRDRYEVIGSVAAAHAADDHERGWRYLRSPTLAVVTTHRHRSRLRGAPTAASTWTTRVAGDLAVAASAIPTASVRTAAGRSSPAWPRAAAPTPGRSRSCPATTWPATALSSRASFASSPTLDPARSPRGSTTSCRFVTTVVDRITPRADDAGRRRGRARHRLARRLSGRHRTLHRMGAGRRLSRPGGRAGRTPAPSSPPTSTPYENRKLWLLNGAHSLLAYAGSMRGHATVADAIGDDTCRGWVEQWWAVAAGAPAAADATRSTPTAARCSTASPTRDPPPLAQIAADGSQKLPVRILPVLRADAPRPAPERQRAGRLAAHLRGHGRARDATRAVDVAAGGGPALGGGPRV